MQFLSYPCHFGLEIYARSENKEAMRDPMKFIFFSLLCAHLLTVQVYAEPECSEQNCEECDAECRDEYPLRLPCERAWSYDEELEAPTSYPGKREDAFYDWLTK